MTKLRLRPYTEVHEITEGMDWKDIRLLPVWLAVERSVYECSCSNVELFEDCQCKPDLPPLSDYFEKVEHEPTS